MSESEETVFVEKMAEVEAEPFQKDLKDLMDMNEQPAIFDEQPVSSTTDKLADFLQPDVQESDPGPEEPELVEAPSSSSSTQQQEADPPIPTTIEDPVEQEPVSSSESPPPAPEAEQTHETNDEVLPVPETEKELTSCMAKWLMKNNVDQRVIDLIYWKCWKKTGAVFAGKIFILWSLTCCTLLSVLTFLSMSFLAVAFLYRIGMTVFNAVQKTTAEHPFKHLLDEDLEISEEAVQNWANEARKFVNTKVKTLKKLFFIEDVVESVKFGVMLWLLSYFGSCFTLLTIAFIACVYTFTVPVLYERNQEKVDACVASMKTKLTEIFSKVQDKLPEKLKFAKAKED